MTISGTIGAALEGASFGIPALAISLETEQKHHYAHSKEVDFSVAAYFTKFFGQMLLEKRMPDDVDVLKVDIPCDATSRRPGWSPAIAPTLFRADRPGTPLLGCPGADWLAHPAISSGTPGSDIYAVFVSGWSPSPRSAWT